MKLLSKFLSLFKKDKDYPLQYKHTCQRCGQKYVITPGKNLCPKCKTPYYLNLPK
ncbi:hypothetical protein ACTQ46_09285 [Gallicola sp. Sow4_E12]|uniref:hypothetical protein n=1 Tax=Gallicola sp. Sow4_E12 TaxID=3438785 RepID=UPI003F8D9371